MANKDVKTRLVGFLAVHSSIDGLPVSRTSPDKCLMGSANYVEIPSKDVQFVICRRCNQQVQIVRVEEMFDGFNT